MAKSKSKQKKRDAKPDKNTDVSAEDAGTPDREAPDASATAKAEKAPEPGAADRERLLRLQADFENFKKRMIRERAETYRRANDDIIEELLPVLDHMEIALEAAGQHDTDTAIVEGFRLVYEQLRAALAKFGLQPVDAAHAEFDHNMHEAISHLPSPDVPENHVITMTRRGYKLGDRLLRAAQVVVSSGAPDAAGVDNVDDEEKTED